MQGLEIVEVPLVGWACLVLTVGLLASLAWQKPFGSGRWKRYYSLVFAQFLFYPAVVAIGVLYRVDTSTRPRPSVNPIADWTIDILFYTPLALSLFWVYAMKGLRWFALCLVALQQLFLFGGAFVAGMSVTGNWL
jgi:hypothetical protein